MDASEPVPAAVVPASRSARVARFARGTLLRDEFPQLLPLIHPTRNPDLDLATLTAGSGRKLWWLCPEGGDHMWRAVVANMTRPNSRCPFCVNQRVSVTNSLVTRYPEVAAEWHPTANNGRRPDQIVYGSNERAWWQCAADGRHQWQTRIVQRTAERTGCPYCTNKRASATNNLAVLYPKVAEQWHPHRNGSLTAATVPAGSGANAWWTCPGGPDHEWQVRVAQRTTGGAGCPFCQNQRVSITNSLATLFPKVAAQLDAELNGGLTPAEVIAGSNKPRWWRCLAGPDHVWKAKPHDRTARGGTGCPACVGHQVSVTNSLATLFPDVAAQWHPVRNGDQRPENVTAYSNTPVWWQCLQDSSHEWKTAPSNRSGGHTGCPFCKNRRVSAENNLAVINPALAAQFDPALNKGITPEQVVASSSFRAVWRCAAGPDHIWEMSVASRMIRDAGCPACRGRKVSVTNSLATRRPDLAAQWHPTRNAALTPNDVIATSSTTLVWWKCPYGLDHEWSTMAYQRTVVGTGCPCCRGLRISVTNSLATRRPDLAAQWHPTRNGALTPEKVVSGSKISVWWKCAEGPDHEWSATLDKRAGRDSTGCPACAGVQVSVTNSLATRSPLIAAQLDPLLNDGLTPDRVVNGSEEKLWWRCPEGPDHTWPAVVSSRTRAGNGCPCCAGQRLSVTNCLATRFPEIATELDPELNEGLTADQLTAGSTKAIEWRCRNNPEHTWTTKVSSRTAGDTNCPVCAVTGYNAAKPGFLYLLRREFDGREQRKIGITNVPDARLAKLRRYGWQPVELSSPLDGAVAREREQAFLAVLVVRGLRSGRKLAQTAREDGYTETWNHADLPVGSLADIAAVSAAIGTVMRVVEKSGG
ncbi:zinc-ribbon domain-containing protein [Micromonospora sp. NPDC004540]|uniref:zinc-ribbon domain-containing protein n=1 Tax=Micromonospora sp. NPDC004540 TaxID=3154457 RepID=UPI0033AC6B01